MVSWGSIYHAYMCILLYVKLIQCSGVAEIYDQLGGLVCHVYMCILLYVKLIWCSGFPAICGQLGGPSALGGGVAEIYDRCAFFYM